MPITRISGSYPVDRPNTDPSSLYNKTEIDSPTTSLRNSIRERVIEVQKNRESNKSSNEETQGVRTFEKINPNRLHLCPFTKCVMITAVAIHWIGFIGYCLNWGNYEINAMPGIPK